MARCQLTSGPHLDREVGPQGPGDPHDGLVGVLLVVQGGVLQTLLTRHLQGQLSSHTVERLALDA